MPWSLKRYHHSGQSHFVTFSCYHRKPLFVTDTSKRTFEEALERVRRSYHLYIYGYVVMPEHVHILLSEPTRETLAEALKSLKQGVARRLVGAPGSHFWQKRYYDFNVSSHQKFVEKPRYIHRNPVERGLCADPAAWPWSSFLHYAKCVEGIVEVESEWTANRRDRKTGKLCPAVELPHSSQPRA